MTTVRQAVRFQFIRRVVCLFLVLAVIGLVSFLFGPQVGAVKEALTPPVLPAVQTATNRVWLEQNWTPQLRQQYHQISQGTHTLPIPLEWLLALERPANNLLSLPFGDKGKFAANDYFLRFGFIGNEVSADNPHGLPIGIAATPYQQLPGLSGRVTAVGFNCAACHTGHFIHGDTEYLVDGGPATTDLGQLTKALGAALGQTLVSSKLPLMKGRFNRFAKAVLGADAYNDANVTALQGELAALVESVAALPSAVDVVEGFSRLDALNRIGNQVFALDTGYYGNYVPIDAPVTYPHIWTSSWFDWVQYDGSIMNPLIRNTGEAMGVSATLDTRAPEGEQRFTSSVPLDNLVWIEKALSGTDPLPAQQFNGLHSPPWPQTLPAINQPLASAGAALYQAHCQECHLPAPNTPEFWTHFAPVTWYEKAGASAEAFEETATDATTVASEQESTNLQATTTSWVMKQTQPLLNVHLIPLAQIGTDPAQADVLGNRTVDTAGVGDSEITQNFPGLGINTDVCTREPQAVANPFQPGYPVQPEPPAVPARLVNINVKDGPTLSFALALGALVQQVNDAWFELNAIPAELQEIYLEGRPNCLQAGQGYKSRPLNGVWATAPFLHNGSVPTVMDLLSPPEQRPARVVLGNINFDPVRLGLADAAAGTVQAGEKYNAEGFFVLDTSVPGNSNQGHGFSNRYDPSQPWYAQPKGVIGPELSMEQRLALIEYLKTL